MTKRLYITYKHTLSVCFCNTENTPYLLQTNKRSNILKHPITWSFRGIDSLWSTSQWNAPKNVPFLMFEAPHYYLPEAFLIASLWTGDKSRFTWKYSIYSADYPPYSQWSGRPRLVSSAGVWTRSEAFTSCQCSYSRNSSVCPVLVCWVHRCWLVHLDRVEYQARQDEVQIGQPRE